MKPFVTSETGVLRRVMLAPAREVETDHEVINATQRYFYRVDPPDPHRVNAQHEAYADLLAQRGVEICWADFVPHAPSQHFTRDIAMVIGETFVINALREPIRLAEFAGIEPVVRAVEGPVERVAYGILEGGDVLIDGDTLYVGLGDRTNMNGVSWLLETFGEQYELVPIPLARDILHLDVTFNLVGNGLALIHPDVVPPDIVEKVLSKRYTLIEVTAAEQFGMATNVVSLSPETVIVDARFTRVHDALGAHGLEVLTVEFDEVAKMGGSLRCCTCPLLREG